MGLVVSELALLSNGGVSGGMRLARPVLWFRIVRAGVLSDWQPCSVLGWH